MSFTKAIDAPGPTDVVRSDGDVEQNLDSEKGGDVTHFSTKQVKPEEVFAATGLDATKWSIKAVKTGCWNGYCKGDDGQPTVATLHKTTLSLVPTRPAWLRDGLELIHERADRTPGDYSFVDNLDRVDRGEPVLGVAGLFDTHVGQYAWAGETGDNNDLGIIEARYKSVVDRIVRKGEREGVTEWRFPIGQDFLHIDNPKNETLRGTGQDVDTRYPKVVDIGYELLRYAIEQMLVVAPVKTTYSRGNHDPTVSYHLCRELNREFADCPDVDVELGWNKRKYVEWNSVLIGLAHGDTEKRDRLAQEMPTANPEAWARTKLRVFFTGHLHHRKRAAPTFEVEDKMGIIFHQLASLSGHGAWEHEMGYHSKRAGEFFAFAADGSEYGNWMLCA